MDASGDSFELKLGKIGHDRAPNLRRVRASIRQASRTTIKQKGRIAPRTGMRGHYAKVAKGTTKVASLAQRRVVVKARYVVHGSGRGAPLRAHVSYLARQDKVTARRPSEALSAEPTRELGRQVDYLSREASEGHARFAFYDRSEISLDAKNLTAAWSDDSRHFRLIVSAEDGAELGELRPFIRELMGDLERKLGTKLQWLAVDHWDTDNPHTHVLIRGRRADGTDLFIPSRVISSGIREHAQEIVTRVLGPRLSVDLARERAREIEMRNVTPLDRELLARSRGRTDELRPDRPDLAARLDRLEGWDLAQRGNGGWRLADGLLGKLKALAERDEIEQVVAAVRRPGVPLLAAERDVDAMGQLVHFGPIDDLGESFLAVIETGRGELRYAKFDRADHLAHLADIPPGAIVTFEPNIPVVRPSDEAVARIAQRTGGLYSAEHHWREEPHTEHSLIKGNIRRLEAMRRFGLVERHSDGVFGVGADHLDRALAMEERISRRYPLSPQVASYWTLGEQVEALGPTHLDRVLAREAAPPLGEGDFAREHASALQQRRLFLIEQGWMGKDDRVLAPSALPQMAVNEMRHMAQRLSHELGKPVLTYVANRTEGVYARRIDLAQGRVALIMGERSAHLVPWRPALERFSGQQVEGLMKGRSLSWELSRGLGIGLPPM